MDGRKTGAETLPRSSRIRRTIEFQQIQRSGKRIGGRHLVAVVRPNGLSEARFGLSVSRKVGSAVVRNRVKRWLREAVRRENSRAAGVDIVIIARSSSATAGYQQLRSELAALLTRSIETGV
jgi:ribonuclease P protein component